MYFKPSKRLLVVCSSVYTFNTQSFTNVVDSPDPQHPLGHDPAFHEVWRLRICMNSIAPSETENDRFHYNGRLTNIPIITQISLKGNTTGVLCFRRHKQ